ncbi:cyclic nucleotide-binding protein [Capnocytophaga stomatis]|uniref:Cyclic nucleotide-binding protein n=1 Tax=Capnocytophaga stomatis TaxID=1848904 RepID=A0A250FY45_9FLAO|nr:Crp/Fnr family transcriptional regulator [Capnocytophaga stomatis]ATA89993.1 cyclic nucleotide-binding protein [Capnocytophaga stomatis]GIJ95188.1 cyclic nucleotide-binding protein [Capnocytophaga stomatis]GIJ95877.1 cyclic nucleotide-binding protein [Capnocytophaga stomatis]
MEIPTDLIYKYFSEITFSKGDYLLRAGEIEKYLYYIESGMVRIFHYDFRKDKETTVDFIFPNQFCLSYESFRDCTPSLLELQAISDVRAYRIDKQLLDTLMKQETFLLVKSQIMEELFVQKARKEIQFLTQSPEEIYKQLIEKEPVLVQKLPLKYIASYIGITPQALSRIRRRIVTE